MNSPVLQLSGVTKGFFLNTDHAVHVLTGTDLTLMPGEVVGLIAPSGAGKSTLLQVAGLLDSADSGQIMVGETDASRANDTQRTALRRTHIGFIYQFHHLLPEFSAVENVALPMRANGAGRATARDRANALLAQVGLAHRAQHRPAELSGGEQQRVAFCRALANGPKLLLADEPTGNLDPETSAHVFDVLLRLVRETGLSALIATHNHDLATQMDRVLRLSGGQLQPA